MSENNKIFRELQIHLDEQTVGFPATKSGSDIQLLKEFFTAEQAKIAVMLTYKYETLETIYERAKDSGYTIEEVKRILDETARRGTIGGRIKDGIRQYRNIPYVVGMVEAAALNPSPELGAAVEAYNNDLVFWMAFMKSKIPQMRTIPIEESITPEHNIGNYDEIENIIKTTVDPIVIIPCVCRKGSSARGEPCKLTDRTETCMVFRDQARSMIEDGIIDTFSGREISKEEALEILRKNQAEGLVLQPSNAQGPDYVCSCCGCCCGILGFHKAVPNPVSFWASNYQAVIDSELCEGCGTCVDKCQTNAMVLDDKTEIARVDLTRCLGCGNCVTSCPSEAIELQKKEKEVIPPKTGEETFEIIVKGKT
ncbi:MAG: 4Fe-4S dicluster domain-containing protein [Promethearchaeota archaeon]